MKPEDAEDVAKLHIETIAGFISDLGLDFLKRLHKEICKSSRGIEYIYEQDHKIMGFITATPDVLRLYRRISYKKGASFLFSLIKCSFRLSTIKRIIQSIFCPLKAKSNCGKAEVLFIGVKAKLRRRQIGKQLLKKVLGEFKKRRISQVKVFAQDKNIDANKFYLSQGFKYIDRIKHYDGHLNVYLIKS